MSEFTEGFFAVLGDPWKLQPRTDAYELLGDLVNDPSPTLAAFVRKRMEDRLKPSTSRAFVFFERREMARSGRLYTKTIQVTRAFSCDTINYEPSCTIRTFDIDSRAQLPRHALRQGRFDTAPAGARITLTVVPTVDLREGFQVYLRGSTPAEPGDSDTVNVGGPFMSADELERAFRTVDEKRKPEPKLISGSTAVWVLESALAFFREVNFQYHAPSVQREHLAVLRRMKEATSPSVSGYDPVYEALRAAHLFYAGVGANGQPTEVKTGFGSHLRAMGECLRLRK